MAMYTGGSSNFNEKKGTYRTMPVAPKPSTILSKSKIGGAGSNISPSKISAPAQVSKTSGAGSNASPSFGAAKGKQTPENILASVKKERGIQ